MNRPREGPYHSVRRTYRSLQLFSDRLQDFRRASPHSVTRYIVWKDIGRSGWQSPQIVIDSPKRICVDSPLARPLRDQDVQSVLGSPGRPGIWFPFRTRQSVSSDLFVGKYSGRAIFSSRFVEQPLLCVNSTTCAPSTSLEPSGQDPKTGRIHH